MNFSDIDFSALGRMMDSMSPEEKEKLNKYAQNMMDNMQQNQEVEEEEEDFYEYLGIEEEEYNHLNGKVLDSLESASDLEGYYEDVPSADYSASILFYGKAVLNLLRDCHFAIYRDVLQIPNFKNPNTTTLYSYLLPLMNDENIQILIDNNIGDGDAWYDHKVFIQQLYTLLSRAEYDFVSLEDLETLKYVLFEERALLNIEKLV